MLTSFALAFSAYLVTGRTGALAVLLYLRTGFPEALGFSLLLDLGQITLYGALLETVARRDGTGLIPRFVARQQDRWKARLEKLPLGGRLAHLRSLAVMIVAMVPFYGFGIHSACILAFALRFKPLPGTLVIMVASLVATVLTWQILSLFADAYGL